MSLLGSVVKAVTKAVSTTTTAVGSVASAVAREFPVDRPAPPRPITVAPAPPRPAPAPTPPPPRQNEVPQYKPQPWVPPTTDADIINEIADCLNRPPTDIDQNYILRSMHIAEYLKVPAAVETAAQLASSPDLQKLFTTKPAIQTAPSRPPAQSTPSNGGFIGILGIITRAVEPIVNQPQVVNPQLSLTQPVVWVANEAGRAVASQSVANVLALISRAENFLARAASSGYAPPDNPFSVIATLNASRNGAWSRLAVDAQLASDLVYSIKVIINLLDAENQGGIDLAHGITNVAQLSHVHLSFDGLGGSGNPAADILRFLPQADEIKRYTEEQALAVLDFSKRIPYILFTMEYKPVHDAPPVGTLIGWKKINDASGYIVNRRDVFTQQELQFTVDNDTLGQLSDVLRDYVKTYATTFFNKIDESSVVVFLDATNSADEYYVYTVQAYQVRSEGQAATFSLQSIPVSLTPTAKSSISQIISSLDPSFSGSGTEVISPWPALSQYLYGNSNYDWILAAVNTRASINRGDSRPDTRSYSYLNAHIKFLFQQADAGKLVKPNDVNDVVNRVNDSVQKFGVQQTVQNLLDETGVSYYYEGRDAREDTHFDRAGTETVQTSNIFAVIGASIDPDTAMLDLQTLASNMSSLLAQNLLTTRTSVQPGSAPNADSRPTEITVPQPNEMTAEQADGPLQFISKLGDMRDPHADLTTFDGISKLMRVIRILSDFGPNRVQPKGPVVSTPPIVVRPTSSFPNDPTRPPITPTPVLQPPVIIYGGTQAGGGCVDPSTRIVVDDTGMSIPITDVRVGSKIWTRTEDCGVFGFFTVSEFERLRNVRVRITTDFNQQFVCSVNHGLCSKGIWRRADTFEVGDILDGVTQSRVRSVEYIGEGEVIRLRVDGASTYFASDGMWHHNAISRTQKF